MQTISKTKRQLHKVIFAIMLCMMVLFQVKAQEKPPRPISVTVHNLQGISFGAFCTGTSGGTVIIYPGGSRSATGDVLLLNLSYTFSPALYDVVANKGTVISILNGPDATLTGNHGGTMTLKIGDSDPVGPFVISVDPPITTLVKIGGTLIVGNQSANPPGDYSGPFYVTFVQQ